MPTPTPVGSDHEAAVSAFADAVLNFLKDNDRPFEWLVRKSGVPSSTLRAQLKENPTRLTYVNAVRISQVIPVHPFEDVAA